MLVAPMFNPRISYLNNEVLNILLKIKTEQDINKYKERFKKDTKVYQFLNGEELLYCTDNFADSNIKENELIRVAKLIKNYNAKFISSLYLITEFLDDDFEIPIEDLNNPYYLHDLLDNCLVSTRYKYITNPVCFKLLLDSKILYKLAYLCCFPDEIKLDIAKSDNTFYFRAETSQESFIELYKTIGYTGAVKRACSGSVKLSKEICNDVNFVEDFLFYNPIRKLNYFPEFYKDENTLLMLLYEDIDSLKVMPKKFINKEFLIKLLDSIDYIDGINLSTFNIFNKFNLANEIFNKKLHITNGNICKNEEYKIKSYINAVTYSLEKTILNCKFIEDIISELEDIKGFEEIIKFINYVLNTDCDLMDPIENREWLIIYLRKNSSKKRYKYLKYNIDTATKLLTLDEVIFYSDNLLTERHLRKFYFRAKSAKS